MLFRSAYIAAVSLAIAIPQVALAGVSPTPVTANGHFTLEGTATRKQMFLVDTKTSLGYGCLTLDVTTPGRHDYPVGVVLRSSNDTDFTQSQPFFSYTGIGPAPTGPKIDVSDSQIHYSDAIPARYILITILPEGVQTKSPTFLGSGFLRKC